MQEDKEKTKERRQLTRRQESALLALIEGSSLPLLDIAKKISVNPSTLWRWRTDPKFQQALQDLLAIITNESAPSGGRVRAAQCVVELSQKSLQLEDLAVRISNLEQAQGGYQ